MDLIDRQEAIDAVNEYLRLSECSKTIQNMTSIQAVLRWLPSAEPETAKRIVGKSRDGMTLWYQCDMCNELVDAHDDFCCRCGRRFIDG